MVFFRLMLKCHSMETSDYQLHEAVVLTDVPLQNVLARPKDTLKACTIKLHAFEGSFSSDSSCTSSLEQQSYFTWSGRDERGEGGRRWKGRRGEGGRGERDRGRERRESREEEGMEGGEGERGRE